MASAAVLGGGIAGLAAGVALSQAGWQVAVYERASRLEPMGAALSMWPNAVEGLKSLGALNEVLRRAMPFNAMLVADQGERPIIPVRHIDGEALVVTRNDLQDVLAGQLPDSALRLGHEINAVTEDGDAVLVRFADERMERADLVVDAGGLRSVASEASPVSYCGYGGVVALSDPVDDGGLNGLAAEYWGRNERFGIFELPENRRYWFYMRDAPAGGPAPSYEEVVARAALFAPAIGRAVAATPPGRIIPYPIHARPAPRSLGHRRLIRVGDAAHAMEPNLGQGACQAIEDAVALGAVARACRADEILASFEQLRLKRVAGIVRRAAEGRHGAHGSHAAQWTMRTVLRLIPSGISDRLARSIQTMPAYAVQLPVASHGTGLTP